MNYRIISSWLVVMSMSAAEAFEHEPISLDLIAYVEKHIELDKNQKMCDSYRYSIVAIKVEKITLSSLFSDRVEEDIDWMVGESLHSSKSHRTWTLKTSNNKMVTEMQLLAQSDGWKTALIACQADKSIKQD